MRLRSFFHAMRCMLGGFRGLMHNEVKYVFYDTAKQAGFKDVVMEPELQALSGESFKYKSANKEPRIGVGSGLDSSGHFSTSWLFRRSPKATRTRAFQTASRCTRRGSVSIWTSPQRGACRFHPLGNRNNWRYSPEGSMMFRPEPMRLQIAPSFFVLVCRFVLE